MAIRGFDKKDPMAGLNQLMQLMNQMDAMGARKEKRISDKMLALSRQVDNAKTLDSLSNIMPAVDSFNKEVSNLGFNEYSLDNIVSEKKRLYSNSENSFNEAKMYLDKGLGDPDELYNEIMGMSWGEANDELNTLYSLSSNINEGIKSGYNFKGEGKYTTTSLSKAVNTRMGQIQNKLDVFAENEGNFLIFNPDGTMDEASKEIYDDLQFKILSGDNKDFDKYFDDVVDGVARNFQIQDKGYNDWLKIYEQSKNFAKLDDMEGMSEEDKESYKAIISGNGEDSDGEISPTFAKQMAEVYRTNAEKYNSQHQVLTGGFYNENPVYKNIDLEDSDIPGTADASNASKVDSNSRKDIKTKKDPEIIIKKEKKSVSPLEGLREERKEIFDTKKKIDVESPPVEDKAYKANLDFEFIKDEASKKNITKSWIKNPKMYNESIDPYIEEILLKSDNISDIIDFGKTMKSMNIDLTKKGAFPGLKEKMDKLEPKILEFIKEAKDSYIKDKDVNSKYYLNTIIKQISNSFSWYPDLIKDNFLNEIQKSLTQN